jgi:hypothetical protein
MIMTFVLFGLGLGVFMLYQSVSNRTQSLQTEIREFTINQASTPLSDSQIARKALEDVISGKRKKPPYQNLEASKRYYKITGHWISELTLDDCVALIESIEEEKICYDMLDVLYERYGELDHQGAMNRVNEVSKKDEDVTCAKITSVLIGWARVEPEVSWVYFLNLSKEGVLPGLDYTHLARRIFNSWANLDHTVAYQYLIKTERRHFAVAVSSYYYGLSDKADFPKEAEQLEQIMKDVNFRDGSFSNHHDMEWTNKELLPATLVSKWANHDMDAAISWWLKNYDSRQSQLSEEDNHAFRMGVLFVIWAGEYEFYPDKALQWANANLDVLQNSYFIEFAIPSLAKHRPSETVELIRKILSKKKQAEQLANVTRAPVIVGDGRYRSQKTSAILSPDLVESLIDSFSFNEAERQQVVDAICGRREYEANQPAPPASEW